MWISKRTDYATRAVLSLALSDDEPVKRQELAARIDVPDSTLEQVMIQLRSAGIVRSERGPSGGYRLNKEPKDISLERIVRIFQGPLAPIGCATRKEPEPCTMESMCSLRDVWRDVRDATIKALRSTTFDQLAARAGGPWRAHLPPGQRSRTAKARS